MPGFSRYAVIAFARQWVVCLLCVLPACVAVSRPGRCAVTLPSTERYIGRHLSYLEDSSHQYSAETILSGEFDSLFVPVEQEVPNFGFISHPVWIRLSLTNSAPDAAEYVMFNHYLVSHVALFTPEGAGRWRVETSGFMSSPEAFPRFSFTLEGNQTRTFYLRAASIASVILPIEIMTADTFRRFYLLVMLGYGLYYGFLVSMMIYNVFLYKTFRSRSYLYHVLFLGSLSVYFLGMDGILNKFVFPADIHTAVRLTLWGMNGAIIMLLLICRHFFSLRETSHRLNLGANVILAATVALLAVSPFIGRMLFNTLTTLAGMATVVAVLTTGMVFLLRGYRPARYFLAGFGIFIGAGFVFGLTIMGVMPFSRHYLTIFQGSIILEVLLMQFALRERVDTLRRERSDAREETRRTLVQLDVVNARLQEYNRTLEQRVEERTREVVEKQEALARQERLYRTLIETSPDAIILSDLQLNIVMANKQAAELFRFKQPEELNGINILTIMGPKNRRWILTRKKEILSTGVLRNFEFTPQVRGRSLATVEVNSSVVTNSDGEAAYFLNVVRDISERKRAENERIERERLKGILELAGAASHEMSQPLQAIIGYSELSIMNLPDNDPSRKNVETILTESKRLTDIVEKLKNITRYATKTYAQRSKIVDIFKSADRSE